MMSYLAERYPGDDVVAFLLTTAIAMALISGFAWLLAAPLARRPALRHSLLLAGSIGIGLAPFLVGFFALTQWAPFRLNLSFPTAKRPPVSTNQIVETHSTATPAASVANEQQSVPVVPTRDVARPVVLPQQSRPMGNRVSPVNEQTQPALHGERPVWFRVFATLVCVFWAMGSSLLMTRYLFAWIEAMRIRRRSRPLPPEWHAESCQYVMDVLQGCRLPEIRVSSEVRTPAVIGLARPCILLPEMKANSLSVNEVQEILIHEVAHVVRGDLWVVHWEAWVMFIGWPIPLVRLVLCELCQAREELCDLYVLTNSDREQYGRTLLRMARSLVGARPVLLATGILQGAGPLERRITRLLDRGRDEATRCTWPVTASILAGFLLLAGIACGTRLMAGAGDDGGNQANSRVAQQAEDTDFSETDESKIIEKLELLGGILERDEAQPNRPVIGVTFNGNLRFTDGYARLLQHLPGLTSVHLESTQITDVGARQLWKIKNLRSLELNCPLVTTGGLKGLGELKNLTSLSLDFEALTDEGSHAPLPEGLRELEQLTNLTTLDLGTTTIQETERIDWKKLKNLQSLVIDAQCNEAAITGLSELTNLTSLGSQYAHLSKKGLLEFGKLKNLKSLDLQCSNIDKFGLSQLGQLTNLTDLNLSHTGITDKRLAGLSRFSNLTTLKMQYTDITDKGLSELRSLTSLRTLELSGTKITDAGMKELAGLTNLTTLELASTQVSDVGLAELKNLSKLVELSVGQEINDAGLKQIGEWKDLVRLELSFARNARTGMAHLRNLKNLQILNLTWVTIDDEGMNQLAGFTNLRELSLEGARISDQSLENLKPLTNLKVLRLGDTRISAVGLQSLGGLMELTILSLYGAKISDADLKHLRGFRNLKELYLDGTNLSDACLGELSEFKYLEKLFLRHTRITNQGLKQFRQFRSLMQLDISNTGVSDDGLDELCELKNVNVLYLAKTQLSQASLDKLNRLLPTMHVVEWQN